MPGAFHSAGAIRCCVTCSSLTPRPSLRGCLDARAWRSRCSARWPRASRRRCTDRVGARQLAISGRTLQRRLAAEGVSYQRLVDDARKEAAGRYLSEPTLAIGEVAYLVGYSEPAPFHRAFKRWYGVTPEIFRQKQRSAPA